MSRRASGEGSIYKRQDGRFVCSVFLTEADGTRKRVSCYGRTRREVEQKLRKLLTRADRGLPALNTTWLLSDYLRVWLKTSATSARRAPRTIELYHRTVEHYLVPRLGSVRLSALTVRTVQAAFDEAAASGVTVRMVCEMKKVLSAALTQAQREELIDRNPARLTTVAPYEAPETIPWTPSQLTQFFDAARSDHFYAAFLLITLYGLRRGELVGLRWRDVDCDRRVIRIRNQLQRSQGQLVIRPVKTKASKRNLPLLPLAEQLLHGLARPEAGSEVDFVFRASDGSPLGPYAINTAFRRIARQTGLPRSTPHGLRHATGTMLKSLGVPVRDAQAILGHASPITTQKIYQHTTDGERAVAMQGVEHLLVQVTSRSQLSVELSDQFITQFRRQAVGSLQRSFGGPGGTRTLDTLLKRGSDNTVPTTLTEVMVLARGAFCLRLLGGAAVIRSCQDGSDAAE